MRRDTVRQYQMLSRRLFCDKTLHVIMTRRVSATSYTLQLNGLCRVAIPCIVDGNDGKNHHHYHDSSSHHYRTTHRSTTLYNIYLYNTGELPASDMKLS